MGDFLVVRIAELFSRLKLILRVTIGIYGRGGGLYVDGQASYSAWK